VVTKKKKSGKKSKKRTAQMRFEQVPIEQLDEYADNPHIIDDQDLSSLSESFKEFGFVEPIIVDKNYMICAGHRRYRTAKKMGFKTVPCIVWTPESGDHFKGYNLAANVHGDRRKYVKDLVAEIVADLTKNDILDPRSVGFSQVEVDTMMERLSADLGKASKEFSESDLEPPDIDQEQWVIFVFKGAEKAQFESVMKFFGIPETTKSTDGSILHKAIRRLVTLEKKQGKKK